MSANTEQGDPLVNTCTAVCCLFQLKYQLFSLSLVCSTACKGGGGGGGGGGAVNVGQTH